MTETQKRIKAYQKALPHMKERVMAVAVLFVMSITMMASASFAWITLSRSPEISGLSTSIATNGNLEIALSDKDGLAPDATTVTDGSGDVTKTNLTWGNLINLSHSSYGLSSLTLRPAQLNDSGATLLKEPLSAAVYDADGRVTTTVSNFAYTNYEIKDGAGAFFVPESGQTQYGVRAISSVTYSSVAGDTALLNLSETAKSKFTAANGAFMMLWRNQKYMNSITSLAGVYLDWRMSNDENNQNIDQPCDDYVEIIYEMMVKYKSCLAQTGEAVVAAANVHHFVYCNNNDVNYVAFTMDKLHDGTVRSTLISEGMATDSTTIKAIDAYLADHVNFNVSGTTQAPFEGGVFTEFENEVLDRWNKSQSVGWVLLSKYVNAMAHIDSATINGTPASSLGGGDLVSIAFASTKICELKKGLIWNMDWFYGGNVSVSGVSVKVSSVEDPIELTQIRTSVKATVEDPSNTSYTNYPIIEIKNEAVTKASNSGLAARDAVAADTYGMAIDFWLKTNSANSLLALSGTIHKDQNGKVIGYTGQNRIWEDNDPDLPVLGESTSQGSGSCYIFYTNGPEETEQAKKLLSAMRVSFIDERGNVLATAYMDTKNTYEDVGRVLVPLQLEAKSIVTGTDKDGNEITEEAFYITSLVQNEATRITAIVYLDGTVLDNASVLAAGSIKGQLNIQFCTSEDLVSVDDPVKSEFINFMIQADNDTFNSFNPNNKPKVKLSLVLSGADATSITGQFVSFISATQGANQPEFSFEQKTAGTWEAEVTFNGPGNFQLRSIRIDGVDYSLYDENPDKNQIVTVNIKGLSVQSLTFTNLKDNVLTADSYYQVDSLLTLSESEAMTASKVQAVFVHDDGQNVTVDYTRTSEGWKARPLFTTSGTYSLTYIIVDGSYITLNTEMCKEFTVYLGLKTQIFLGLPMTERYAAAVEALENEKEEALDALYDAQDAEIADVEANTALSEEEKLTQIAAIEARYEPQITAVIEEYKGLANELYKTEYGEDGLEMTESADGYMLKYDGSEHLFMDVSCIITNDKDEPMKGLQNVVLYYGNGADKSTGINAELIWNSSTNRYEAATEGDGRFVLVSPGSYSFHSIDIGTGEEKNTIYYASKAPKLTAMSPYPMEYIGSIYDGQQLNPEKFTEISATFSDPSNRIANRYMYIALKNASAATVKFEMSHSENPGTTYYFDGVPMVIDDSDKENVITYFYPKYTSGDIEDYGVPEDGTWTINNVKVANVFYNDAFYDGAADSETGWVDLSEFVANDEGNLSTDFFTTVKFSVNKQPSTLYNSSPLAEVNTVTDMVITITDAFGKAIDGVEVNLSYTWDQATKPSYYEIVSGSYTNTQFGGKLTSSDGTKFAMSNMNFQQAGEYKVNFGVTVEGVNYTNIDNFVVPSNGAFEAQNVKVNYNVFPTLKVTDVTGALLDENGYAYDYTTFSVDTNLSDGDGVAYVELSGVKNYFEDYYANLYIATSAKGTHSVPTASLALSNVGLATEAKISMSATNWSKTYTFNSSNSWRDTQEIGGKEDVGSVMGFLGAVADRYYAGTQTIKMVQLKFGSAQYNVKLTNDVTIKQDKTPIYTKVTVDITKVDMPSFNAVDSKGKSFVVEADKSNVVNIISPNGEAFKLTLPGLSTDKTRYVDKDGTAVFENADGTATNNRVSVAFEGKDGCGDPVTKYKVYRRYTRTGTITAVRETYQDHNSVTTWKVGSSNANAETTVSITSSNSGVAITANITTTSKLLSTTTLDNESITQEKWVLENSEADSSSGSVISSIEGYPTDWTTVAN